MIFAPPLGCTSRLDVFFSVRRARDALTQAQQHAHHNARQFAEDVAHGVAWHQASSDNGAPGGLGRMEAELAARCKTTSPTPLAL